MPCFNYKRGDNPNIFLLDAASNPLHPEGAELVNDSQASRGKPRELHTVSFNSPVLAC